MTIQERCNHPPEDMVWHSAAELGADREPRNGLPTVPVALDVMTMRIALAASVTVAELVGIAVLECSRHIELPRGTSGPLEPSDYRVERQV
jgi:hypothetical protein